MLSNQGIHVFFCRNVANILHR